MHSIKFKILLSYYYENTNLLKRVLKLLYLKTNTKELNCDLNFKSLNINYGIIKKKYSEHD